MACHKIGGRTLILYGEGISMKRLLAFLLISVFLVSLTSCVALSSNASSISPTLTTISRETAVTTTEAAVTITTSSATIASTIIATTNLSTITPTTTKSVNPSPTPTTAKSPVTTIKATSKPQTTPTTKVTTTMMPTTSATTNQPVATTSLTTVPTTTKATPTTTKATPTTTGLDLQYRNSLLSRINVVDDAIDDRIAAINIQINAAIQAGWTAATSGMLAKLYEDRDALYADKELLEVLKGLILTAPTNADLYELELFLIEFEGIYL